MIHEKRPTQEIETNSEEIDTLVRETGGIRLSVFLPLKREGVETEQNAILLNILLDDARHGLKKSGMEQPKIEAFLEPLILLSKDADALLQEAATLALFLNENGLRTVRISYLIEPYCCVSDRFAIKPLLPLLQLNPTFTVLDLNQGGARVFRGVRGNLKQIAITDMPVSTEDMSTYDDPEASLQNYSSTRASREGAPGSGPVSGFHGQGMPDTYREDLQKRFFHKVAQTIESFLVTRKDPLIVFGVAGNLGHFFENHSKSQRIYLSDAQDASEWSAKQLSENAYKLLKPEMDQEVESRLELLEQAAGQGKEIGGVAECALAAATGRIESAMIAIDEQVYGHCDLDNMQVHLTENSDHLCSQDLLDFIASETYRHGGSVIALPKESLPGERRAVAVGRF